MPTKCYYLGRILYCQIDSRCINLCLHIDH
uniref:Uncharacterized protein n=1 Tax=Siphoviridae sp. cttFh17 TaxID=2826491 RepID=A0A8S5NI25_9CAUD|nr:MAG TPA: hypothetical protein [Siphoviridae sp. cttFh17]